MNGLKRIGLIIAWIGIMLILMSIVDLIDNVKKPLAFEELKVSQLKKGKIVEGEVPVNFGCFEESYRTRNGIKTTSSKYYYVVLVEGKAIALKCNDSTSSALSKQANAYLNYSDGDETAIAGVPIKGKIKGMNRKTKKYLKEYLYDEESGMSFAEIEPYVIENRFLSTKQCMATIRIGLVLAVIPLSIIILARRIANRS